MITIQAFLWLIHYGLLAMYGWEIGLFTYNRLRHPDAYKQSASIPEAGESAWEASHGTTVVGMVAFHCLIYGLIVSAVPIVLMIYVGAAIYCMWRNEIAKPLLRSRREASRGKRPDKLIAFACGLAAGIVALLVEHAATGQSHAPVGGMTGVAVYWVTREVLKRLSAPAPQPKRAAPNPDGARSHSRDDDDGFAYDAGRFRSEGSPGDRGSQQQSYSAEADYENALREAQKWADQASSRENAARWADKFEELAGNPSLHPKDKLRYRLSAMLLRERLKGQGRGSASGSQGPTAADLTRLGLPVPPQ